MNCVNTLKTITMVLDHLEDHVSCRNKCQMVFWESLPAGIRQLQLMLLKVALLLGIEIHVNVEFKALIEPPEDQENESKITYTFHRNMAGQKCFGVV